MSLVTSLSAVLTILRTDTRSLASRALAARRSFPFAQFGQANDTRTANGSTGCTDTVLQFLALLLKKRWYTHDQIRGAVNNRTPSKGLSYPQVAYWLESIAKLPYKVALGLSADQILSYARTRGPVLVGEMYYQHPEWRGYRYQGARATGRFNGYAHPAGKTGKNQLTGFVGRHAVLVIAVAPIPDWDGTTGVYIFEPNHNSSARPEDVAYDVITVAQFKRLMVTYAAANGKTYAAIPTRDLDVAA
jgi:hypothetical protein